MNYINKLAWLATIMSLFIISCNDSKSSKEVTTDSGGMKFNPAGQQKTTSTYDPTLMATDTMYKNVDSVPK